MNRESHSKIVSLLKRRWFCAVAGGVVLLITVNAIISNRIHDGIRAIATAPNGASGPAVFRSVGPATREAIQAVAKGDYTISVRPLDRLGESLLVTHTAILTSPEGTLGLRIRAVPLRGGFDIVGHYTVR